LALVTDGCASYAILGYIQISWGSSEDARVRKFSKKNKFFFTLHPRSAFLFIRHSKYSAILSKYIPADCLFADFGF